MDSPTSVFDVVRDGTEDVKDRRKQGGGGGVHEESEAAPSSMAEVNNDRKE